MAGRQRRLAPEWVWIALLGVGMIVGGGLAWLVAATRVVLPYDEAFVGLSRDELVGANARLLPFLAHDRVTLAGTMVAIGVVYAGLAFYPLRRGEVWARRAVRISGAVGFASFFLFLGFGYFDPLHALVTVLLLPFFVLGLRARPSATRPGGAGRESDHAARALGVAADDAGGRWGRFLFVAVGAGLTMAGVALAGIGVTAVFVPEDFVFMNATRAELDAISPRLVPLIAHDRAGLGGALLSNGLGVLLTALWGFRPGARWLWWTMLASGVPGFVAAIGTHHAVGYVDPLHLAPALAGAALYAVALAVSYPVLVRAGRIAPASHRVGAVAP